MAARSFLYGGDSGGGANGGGGGSGFNSVLLTNKRAPCSSSKPVDSFFVSGSSHSFAGSRSMVSFEEGGNGSGRSFFQTIDHQEDINGDDEYDDYFQHPEKKRRLKSDQVVFLEKSFETDNKLEPDRKIQLAKDLGLQPRQIAIWFQNRRARWKTKQLEKDYDLLQQSFNQLKQNYDNLLQEKEKLKSEVHDLNDKLLLREMGKGASDDSSSTKSPSEPLQQEQGADCLNDEDVGVKSDSTESRSPGFVELLMERDDSSYNLFQVREDQSDESLEEEDKLGKMFVTPVSGCYMLPKMESGGGDYPEIDAVNSSYIGFHGHVGDEDQDQDQEQSFGFWSFTELTRID